jgi:hypothetical protein
MYGLPTGVDGQLDGDCSAKELLDNYADLLIEGELAPAHSSMLEVQTMGTESASVTSAAATTKEASGLEVPVKKPNDAPAATYYGCTGDSRMSNLGDLLGILPTASSTAGPSTAVRSQRSTHTFGQVHSRMSQLGDLLGASSLRDSVSSESSQSATGYPSYQAHQQERQWWRRRRCSVAGISAQQRIGCFCPCHHPNRSIGRVSSLFPGVAEACNSN